MADEIRLTVMKVVERRILYNLEEVLGFLLTLRSMKISWLGLDQVRNLLGMKCVSWMVIKRWGGGTGLQVGLSHTNGFCGTGSSFVRYHRLIHLLL